MTLTVAEYVDDTYAIESMARRLIAKDLKIVTGTLTWSASSNPGSAGAAFDYSTYGTRFLWMGFNPRPLKTPTAAAQTVIPYLIYDPVAKKIYLAECAGDGEWLQLAAKNEHPTATETLVVGFVLLVYEGGASAGAGVG